LSSPRGEGAGAVAQRLRRVRDHGHRLLPVREPADILWVEHDSLAVFRPTRPGGRGARRHSIIPQGKGLTSKSAPGGHKATKARCRGRLQANKVSKKDIPLHTARREAHRTMEAP